ncbi:MAG: hypothetical protein PHU88_03475 [candidate division Zixibacteria bacterium]|nr:hypothetical protein [candidate division Zixibacteria bacterium]
MPYLDYSEMPAFLERFFNHPGELEKRLVGPDRKYDSGYFDIIRFFGLDKILPENILIKYLPHSFCFNEPLIAEYSELMEKQLRLEKRLYPGPTVMNLAGFDLGISPAVMTVQDVAYGMVAGSSYTLDFKHPLFKKTGGTLRYYYKTQYPSHRLEDSPLANCLGVCGYLVLNEENKRYLLQVTRSARVASLENTRGPSVAGGVDFVKGYANLKQLMDNALSEEIKEELNIDKGHYTLVPLAYAREIFRGERPQLFMLVETSLTRKDIINRRKIMKSSFEEIADCEFIVLPSGNTLDTAVIDSLNHEARMNYYLMREYWSQGG